MSNIHPQSSMGDHLQRYLSAILLISTLCPPFFSGSATAGSPSIGLQETLYYEVKEVFGAYIEDPTLQLSIHIEGLDDSDHNLTFLAPSPIESQYDDLPSENLSSGLIRTVLLFNGTSFSESYLNMRAARQDIDPLNLWLENAPSLPYIVLEQDRLVRLRFHAVSSEDVSNLKIEVGLPKPAESISVSSRAGTLGCSLLTSAAERDSISCELMKAGESLFEVELRNPVASMFSSRFSMEWPGEFADHIVTILDGEEIQPERDQRFAYIYRLHLSCEGTPGNVGYFGDRLFNLSLQPTDELWMRLDPTSREEIMGVSSKVPVKAVKGSSSSWYELSTDTVHLMFASETDPRLYLRVREKAWQLHNCTDEYTSVQLRYLRPYLRRGEKGNEVLEDTADEIIAGSASMAESAHRLHNWVYSEIDYDEEHRERLERGEVKPESQDAGSVFLERKGVCTGKANLLIEMLRSAGIAARPVDGTTLHGTLEANWSKNHRWCQFYEPSLGWIDVDPTMGDFALLRRNVVEILTWNRDVEIDLVQYITGDSSQILVDNLESLHLLVNTERNPGLLDLLRQGSFQEVLLQLHPRRRSWILHSLVGLIAGIILCTVIRKILSKVQLR